MYEYWWWKPYKNFNFWVTSHFKIFPLLMKKLNNVHAMWFFKLTLSRSGEESHQTGSQTPELFISSFHQFLEEINCKRGAKVSCIAWTLYFWIKTVCSRIYIINCSSKSSRLFKLCMFVCAYDIKCTIVILALFEESNEY